MLNFIELTHDNVNELKFDTNDDPVRPEFDLAFRLGPGRRVYVLEENNEYKAAICIAFVNRIPTNVEELSEFTLEDSNIAIAYTVWSNAPRAGRDIVFRLATEMEKSNHVERLITLSPKTDMAHRFHLNNGAFTLNNNATTDNYEYRLQRLPVV